MPTLGQGFGRDLVVGTRPVVSVAQQKAYSSWYNRQQEDDRPDWLMGKQGANQLHGSSQQASDGKAGPPRVGEWKLVWKPKESQPAGTSEQMSKGPQTRMEENKHGAAVRVQSRPGTALGHVSARSSARRLQASSRSKQSNALPANPNSSAPSTSRGDSRMKQTGLVQPLNFKTLAKYEEKSYTAPKQSSRSQASNVSGLSGLSGSSTMSKCTLESSSSRPKRLGTARSGRSASSLGSYSSLGSSVSAVEHREILKRIEGLEQALKTETALRQRMQSLLEHQELP